MPENISGASPLGGQCRALLEATPEATLVVSAQCRVLHANKAARQLLGRELADADLLTVHNGDSAELTRYLARCRGTADPLVGVLRTASDQFRLSGCRVDLGSEAAALLRLEPKTDRRFVHLTRQVAELHREVRDRLHAEAVLSEALAERDLLLRELQHRVKNNMHMLQGLLQGAKREAESEEARRALGELAGRVAAIGTVQQLLYNTGDIQSVGSGVLVEAVVESVLALAGGQVESELRVEPFEVPIEAAIPFSLILNELLTNALKHGRPREGARRIDVGLTRSGDWVELCVQDNGPGFVLGTDRKRASGTGLVRGLVRQLGGSFEVQQDKGAKCLVKFKPWGSQADGSVH